MSKKLINKIFKDLNLNLEIIQLNKNYITITNEERTFMKHYKIKES